MPSLSTLLSTVATPPSGSARVAGLKGAGGGATAGAPFADLLPAQSPELVVGAGRQAAAGSGIDLPAATLVTTAPADASLAKTARFDVPAALSMPTQPELPGGARAAQPGAAVAVTAAVLAGSATPIVPVAEGVVEPTSSHAGDQMIATTVPRYTAGDAATATTKPSADAEPDQPAPALDADPVPATVALSDDVPADAPVGAATALDAPAPCCPRDATIAAVPAELSPMQSARLSADPNAQAVVSIVTPTTAPTGTAAPAWVLSAASTSIGATSGDPVPTTGTLSLVQPRATADHQDDVVASAGAHSAPVDDAIPSGATAAPARHIPTGKTTLPLAIGAASPDRMDGTSAPADEDDPTSAPDLAILPSAAVPTLPPVVPVREVGLLTPMMTATKDTRTTHLARSPGLQSPAPTGSASRPSEQPKAPSRSRRAQNAVPTIIAAGSAAATSVAPSIAIPSADIPAAAASTVLAATPPILAGPIAATATTTAAAGLPGPTAPGATIAPPPDDPTTPPPSSISNAVPIVDPIAMPAEGATPTPVIAVSAAVPVAPAPMMPVATAPADRAPGVLADATPKSQAAATPTTQVPPPPTLASGSAGRVFAAALHAAAMPAASHPQGTGEDHDPMVAAMLAGSAVAQAAPVVAAQGAGVDLSQPGWPTRMAEQIEALRDAADATSTSIRVIPDALGPVDLQVRRDGDQVHVHFSAANPETRTLIADARPQLAAAAADRGLKLGETSVGGGAASWGSGAGQSGGNQGNPGQGSGNQPTRLSTPASTRSSPSLPAASDDAATDTRIA